MEYREWRKVKNRMMPGENKMQEYDIPNGMNYSWIALEPHSCKLWVF